MAERAPQLIMRRPHLLNLPAPRVPQGYEIRHFRKGDEAGWNALMDLAFERTPGRSDFTRDMAADEFYRPERVRLVRDDAGASVATASCWHGGRCGDDSVILHYVAADPALGGRGLGTAVSLDALQVGLAEGRSRAFLLTDDFRVPALKTYLRLAFEPVISHDSHPGRWRMILDELSWSESFEAVLAGPVASFERP